MRFIAAVRLPDPFVLSLVGVILAATLCPCSGALASIVHAAGVLAISSLFFLQGARLSRDAVVGGIMHWRLHATIAVATFILLPLAAVFLTVFFHRLLPQPFWVGVMFACALPSTVQSSIALTSMAEGNVAGAVCAATGSNLAGMVLTPVIFAALSRLHGGGASVRNVGLVIAELLVPFVIGHLLRPWIGHWAEQNRRLLSFTDRGSILLVVYSAFSAAVINGVWHNFPPATLLLLGLIMAVVLLVALAAILAACRTQQFGRADEVAAVFCGSQKSLVTGVPMANALFSGAAIGPSLIPIMIYYPMQLVVCAWLARRYANNRAIIPGWSAQAPAAAIMPLSDRI
ncbi:MAG TPA: bile acid:sodium symporter family protein [Acetobacteraceae bacterium]|nr:bile acid:sodium symporter family protein [Acetobacteraceae bacterium]